MGEISKEDLPCKLSITSVDYEAMVDLMVRREGIEELLSVLDSRGLLPKPEPCKYTPQVLYTRTMKRSAFDGSSLVFKRQIIREAVSSGYARKQLVVEVQDKDEDNLIVTVTVNK